MSKTQSRLGVTIPEPVVNLSSTIYDYYLDLVGADGLNVAATATPAKIDFTTFAENGTSPVTFFTPSLVSNNFVHTSVETGWSFEYTISYNQFTSDPIVFTVQLFKNGVAVANQLLKDTFVGTSDIYTSKSRTGTFYSDTNDIWDFRVSAVPDADFEVTDLEILIKPLTFSV